VLPRLRAPQRYPKLLLYAPAALERKWSALCAPALDIPLPVLTAALAAAAAKRTPTGSDAADADADAGADAPADDAASPPDLGGLGFTPSQALRIVAAFPTCLAYTTAWLLARRAWVQALGVRDLGATFTRCPNLLGLSLSTLEEKRALLAEHGACPRTVVARMPTTMGLARSHLSEKLRFAREVMGLPLGMLERVPVYMGLALQRRTRPRFFLLEQMACGAQLPPWRAGGGEAPRGPSPITEGCSPVTWIKQSDAAFAARALRGTPAAAWGVAGVRAHTASPAFGAWADAREAELRAFHAGRPPQQERL
jgi:hypothetical protein